MALRSRVPLPMDQIEAFCRKWRIVEFALFGSVLRDEFRPDSDVDVMVTFAPEARVSLWDWGPMTDELRVILGHQVDLVERAAIERSENYIRRKHILRSAETVYVA